MLETSLSGEDLVAVAQRARDRVWQGRTIDEIPDDELPLATDLREIWQELTSRLMNGTL